jgi:hypothetical protein
MFILPVQPDGFIGQATKPALSFMVFLVYRMVRAVKKAALAMK